MNVREALAELVRLKDIKDAYDLLDDPPLRVRDAYLDDYLPNKDKAWRAARLALNMVEEVN